MRVLAFNLFMHRLNVLLEDKAIKPKVENTLKEAFKIIKRLQKGIKDKDKEIKRLANKNHIFDNLNYKGFNFIHVYPPFIY